MLFTLMMHLLVILASAIPSHQLHQRQGPRYGHHGQPAKYEHEVPAADEALLRLRLTPPSYLLGKILSEIIRDDNDDALRLFKRGDEKPLGIPRTKPIHRPSGGAKPKPRHSEKKHHKRSAVLDEAPFNPLSYRFGKHQEGMMKGCALCNAAGHSRNHHLHAGIYNLPNGLPDVTENVDPAILERLLQTIISKRKMELSTGHMDEAELLLGGGFWEWPEWWPSWGGEKEPPTCPIKEENEVKSYANGQQRLEEVLRQQQAKLRGKAAKLRGKPMEQAKLEPIELAKLRGKPIEILQIQDGIVHTWKGKPIIEIMSFVPGLGESGAQEGIIKPLNDKKPMPKPRDEIDEEEPVDEEEPSKLPGWLQSICDYFNWDCSNLNWPFSSQTDSNLDKRRLLNRAACALSLGALLTMVAISIWTILGIFFPDPYNRLPKDGDDLYDDDVEEDEEEFSRAEKGFSKSGIMPSAHDGCIKCGKH